MAVNVGSASVTIMPSMSGFGAKMDKALSGAGASGGSSFSKAFGSNVDPAKGGILKRFRSAGADAGGAMADAAGKGIGAKGAAIAGAVGGLASSIGSTLIGAIGNLTGG